jgi:imidazolonepropionase-like amidohydrolase
MPIRLLPLVLLALPAAGAAQTVVTADTLWTMTGPPIADAVVVIGADGRITAIGPRDGTPVPTTARQFHAAHVTPGFIDAHTVVGLAGYLNQSHDQDQLETSDPLQPELRAVDAYNAREALVDWQRQFGTTTMHTGHGPGALASGQTMLVKTRGEGVAEATLRPAVAVAMTLGPDVSGNFPGKSPGTRSKGVAMLRGAFIAAREYDTKRSADSATPRNLRHEAFAAVLRGELAALITAHTVVDILGALRLQEEFGFRLILDGAAESHQVADRIAAAGVPVILHPTMARHGGVMKNAAFTSLRTLRDAGVVVALQSGFEGYVPKTRVPLFEAAMATAFGSSRQEALSAITVDAARILGVADRIGSLAVGMDGDLVLFDGDPIEYLTRVCGVLIEGRPVSEGCH